MIPLILDGLVIVLLVATIVYCVLLNRRLGAMRRNEDELQLLIASFNQATARAEAGIGALKKAAEGVRESLHGEVEDAKALYDELSFMLERGDALAERMGGRISEIRNEPSQTDGDTSSPSAGYQEENKLDASADEDEESFRSRAEQELLKTLGMTR